jgi:hypothetical protein
MARTTVSDHVKEIREVFSFKRYPDISHRQEWEGLSAHLKKEIIEAGEEAQKAPWTQLLISDFTEFSKSGNRLAFEDKYFPRRRKLAALIMAECTENRGRFLDDILDGLYLILEESTWCLPAHNSYVRDTPQEYLPDISRPIIDLFDAETGAFVAMAEYLLRPVFEKISPCISGYVNDRLSERIFKPYFNEHFWWMGNGKEPMCNWTPWITQNVLICALTREEDFFSQEENLSLFKKAARSLDYFLDEYGDDGCCNEGAQYYSHAGLCLFGALFVMEGALGGDGIGEMDGKDTGESKFAAGDTRESGGREDSFADIFRDTLIRNIGNYIVKMHACGDYYFNFADCSPICGRRTAREFLYGKAIGDEALVAFAARDYQKGSRDERLISDEINLFYHVMQVFACDEMDSFDGKQTHPSDCFFESTGLMIARDEHFVLAAKAGNNADSHNHNDVGSFTVYKDGKPLIIDLGVETYTKKTFSEDRYEIWTMQSQFHNLPTFIREGYEGFPGRDPSGDAHDPLVVMESDGSKFCAVDVKCNFYENPALSMDIAGAYNCDEIKSYRRKVELIKGEGIAVTDEYEGEPRALLSLMTYEKPQVSAPGEAEQTKLTLSDGESPSEAQNNLTVIRIGDLGKVTVSGASVAKIETCAITDPRLAIAWKHEVYRVLLAMDDDRKCRMLID